MLRNTGLEEARAGIKIAGRNINILRDVDDTTLMEKNEELKRLLMKMKEKSEKVGFNSTFKKLRSWHLVPFTSRQIDGKSRNSDRFYFLGLQYHCRL